MSNHLTRVVVAGFLGLLGALTACDSAGGETAETSLPAVKPIIDTEIPASFETATFALG